MRPPSAKQREAALFAAGNIEQPATISIVNLAAGGLVKTELSDEERDRLLAKCAAGEYVKLTIEVLAYEHQNGKRNRRNVRLRDGAVPSAAKTAAGRPFLRDHLQGDTTSRGGTILESRGVRRGEGDYAIVMVVELTAPWAVDLALRGLLTFVSVGLRATGPVLCSHCETEVLTECWHLPGDEIGTEPGDAPDVCEWIYTSAEIVECSAVNVPAVPGAHIEGIRAALSAALGGNPPEGNIRMLVRLATILSLAATAGETEILSAVETQSKRVKSLEAELNIARNDLSSVTTERDSLKDAKLAAEASAFIDDAIGHGKIAPADKESWSALYAADQAKAVELMEKRKPGTATPAGKPRQAPIVNPENKENKPGSTETLSAKVDAALTAQGMDPAMARASAKVFGATAEQVTKNLAAALGINANEED